jgi:hypothetical protein
MSRLKIRTCWRIALTGEIVLSINTFCSDKKDKLAQAEVGEVDRGVRVSFIFTKYCVCNYVLYLRERGIP